MIVRSLRVCGWRCFVEEVTVGPFGEGINVLFAPNGTGKSTLFEALCRALLDGHRVSGREVESLRPWGRALSFKVAVEFRHDGADYRIRKHFLEGACSALERKEKGRWRALAENDRADEHVRALLTQNPPGRGLAQRRNWGLAQVLWAPQGNLALKELTDDLGADIRSMLGAQVAGPASGPLEARIEELYYGYFTPSGKLRSGRGAPKLLVLSDQLENAKARASAARALHLAFEEASRRVEHLRFERAQSRAYCEQTAKKLKTARERLCAYSALQAQAERRQERSKSAEAQYRQLKEHVDLITSTEEEVRKAEERVAALEQRLSLIERERQAREQDLATVRAALEDARKGREEVARAEAEAAAARKYVEARRELERLSATIKRVEEAEKVLAQRRKVRGALVAPSAHELKEIRRLAKKRDETRLKVEASLVTLEAVAEKDMVVQVVAGEDAGPRRLLPGKPERIKGSPEVVVGIPGVARLSIWGPSGSVEEHRGELVRALADRAAPFGTQEPEELEALAEKARELDTRVAREQTEIETLLGERKLEELYEERAALAAVAARMRQEHPQWADSPPDAEAMAARAEEVRGAFIAAVETKESQWTKAQAACSATSGCEQASRAELEELRRHLAALRVRLATLAADGKRTEERREELRRLLMAWDAAKERVEEVREAMARFEGEPAAEVERLERRLEQVREQAEKAVGAERMEQGKLEQLCAQGPYSALAAAEEEVSELEGRIATERTRVEAVRLLYQTLSQVRAEALACVSRPVEAAATRTFQRIAGRKLGSIRVDEAFEPSGVRPQAASDLVEIASLSGGRSGAALPRHQACAGGGARAPGAAARRPRRRLDRNRCGKASAGDGCPGRFGKPPADSRPYLPSGEVPRPGEGRVLRSHGGAVARRSG